VPSLKAGNLDTVQLAIIAALEREIQPLVRNWQRTQVVHDGRSFTCYRHEELLVLAGGIGCEAAKRAARAMVARHRPRMLVSAGFAGALILSLKVGSVIVPNVIVDGATGAEYRCNLGEGVLGGGILVSAGQVAGSASKTELVKRFHALAVDMEAAGVAEVAREEQIGFRCVKAISDESDFPMPPVNRFIDGQGTFETARFARWLALRPAIWPSAIALARNSNRAAQALCDWLREKIASGLQPATVIKLAAPELLEVKN
jgi:adenosylhomocysteine nucleosidase